MLSVSSFDAGSAAQAVCSDRNWAQLLEWRSDCVQLEAEAAEYAPHHAALLPDEPKEQRCRCMPGRAFALITRSQQRGTRFGGELLKRRPKRARAPFTVGLASTLSKDALGR